MWFNLIQYIVEDFRVNESFGTLCLRTEAACQIADTCDLNIYFFERFQLGSPFCLGGRNPTCICDPANMRHPYYIGFLSRGKLFDCSKHNEGQKKFIPTEICMITTSLLGSDSKFTSTIPSCCLFTVHVQVIYAEHTTAYLVHLH